jgi:hypothetical protein
MTKALDMKDVDWLKLYVNSEVDKFEKEFGYRPDQQEIEDICKIVANLKLLAGVDVFYAMMLLIEGKETQLHLDSMLVSCELKRLTLGLDVLVYIHSQISEGRGYDSEVAFIFKNCIQYTIPF